jgi:hypothetical protein
MSDIPIDRILSHLKGVRKTATGWVARCPAHEDRRPSLSITKGSDGTVLVKCHAGCKTPAIVAALGLSLRDLFPSKSRFFSHKGKSQMNVVATYDYLDSNGQLLFQAVRLDPKDFLQRRPDPQEKGGWVWNLNGVRRVLYRLPQVLKAVAHVTYGRPAGVRKAVRSGR